MIENAKYGNDDGTIIIADVDGVVRMLLTEDGTPDLWAEAILGYVAPYNAPVVPPPTIECPTCLGTGRVPLEE